MSATKKSRSPHQTPPHARLRPAYRAVVFALLLLFAGEIVLSSRQQSQTTDEADHLYAGYEYWKHGDFGRNPEHPPLVKLVAAAALLPLSLAEPDGTYSNFKSRDFYDGARFLYGSDADMLLARGRGMLLLFGLGLALAVFAAAREMFSAEAGLLALAVFCFEPILLANGGLILTDVALSCLLFASVYAFYRYVMRPTRLRLLLCCTAAGLAVVAKQSGVFLFPMLAAIAITDTLPGALQTSQKTRSTPPQPAYRRLLSAVTPVAVIAIASYAMLWAFYGFRYAARPEGLAMLPTLEVYSAAIPAHFAVAAIAFCANHRLLPEAYLYGWADILQVPGTRDSFVLGSLRTGSWRLGLPAMLLMKTTIGLIALLLLVPVARVYRRRREFLFLALPAACYLLIAILSGMNAEARYVLPIYPFCIVLAGAAAWEMARRSRTWAVAAGVLVLSAATSSMHAFPNYLAYANEAFGGPGNSWRLMSGTNGDAGQGLKQVKKYLDAAHTSDCWFDYVNPFVDPKYYGIPCRPLVTESMLRGASLQATVPPVITGTVLISATEMAGRSWEPDVLNPYAQFTHLRPDAQAGNTVLAYRGTFQVPLLAAYSHSVAAKQLAAAGRMQEAIAEAQQAANLAPDSAAMQASLGLTLLQAGRKEEGQQVNATALRLARSVDPEFQLQLIHLLETPGLTPPVKPSRPQASASAAAR